MYCVTQLSPDPGFRIDTQQFCRYINIDRQYFLLKDYSIISFFYPKYLFQGTDRMTVVEACTELLQ